MIFYGSGFAITWAFPTLRIRKINLHADIGLHGELTYSKDSGSAVVATAVVLSEAYGFQPGYCAFQLFNDIIDDAQHIKTVLATFLKHVDKSQHLQSFSRRIFHCHTNVPGNASLTKPVGLALSVLGMNFIAQSSTTSTELLSKDFRMSSRA